MPKSTLTRYILLRVQSPACCVQQPESSVVQHISMKHSQTVELSNKLKPFKNIFHTQLNLSVQINLLHTMFYKYFNPKRLWETS